MNLDFVLVLFIFLYICLVLFGNAIFNKYGDYIIFMCYIWSIIYCLFIYIAAFFIVLYGFNCVFDFCFSFYYPNDCFKPLDGKVSFVLIPEEELKPAFKDCHITSVFEIMKKVHLHLDQAEALVREITRPETVVELDKETLLRKEIEAMDIMRDCLDMIYTLEPRLTPKGLFYFSKEFSIIGEDVKLMLLKLEHTQHWRGVFYDNYTIERLSLLIKAEGVDFVGNRFPFYFYDPAYGFDGFNEYLSKKYTFVRSGPLWLKEETDLRLSRMGFMYKIKD